MKSKPRRRKPGLPEFAPLDSLAPGQAFNPYRLFKARSVNEKILGFPKLAPGAKLVWFMLASGCYLRGFVAFTESEMSGKVALSRRQFGRHMRKLKKLHLVHVEHEIGTANKTWLIYHSLFAFSTPLPPRTNDVSPPADVAHESPHMWRGINSSNSKHRISGSGQSAVGTSSRGSSDELGEEEAKDSSPNGKGGKLPITNRSATPQISKDARAFWFSLSPVEKRNRSEQAARVAERIRHFRQYLNDTDSTIASQARRELARYSDELRSIGFYIPS